MERLLEAIFLHFTNSFCFDGHAAAVSVISFQCGMFGKLISADRCRTIFLLLPFFHQDLPFPPWIPSTASMPIVKHVFERNTVCRLLEVISSNYLVTLVPFSQTLFLGHYSEILEKPVKLGKYSEVVRFSFLLLLERWRNAFCHYRWPRAWQDTTGPP